ncbi:WxL protein peptidoglycan domain-containing protein [Actinoplanes derwentensis]|uniref:WxL Interacting Protein peptidoglycan binding domain-containing protein n=1 Tax=Actinoplanes derwentensis TaxID=113562 RepID=A0A1H1SSM1_9ACTN|nr:DUF916 domain-containing protein [Actinoplanes derwentensis]GID83223.1 hypothetical protein Ade03nite_21470 [Actinoplanes derwentensis]SDS50843.1 protein of unknown function [Actinoplanes derwentensis]
MKTVVVALLAALAIPPVQAADGDVTWTVRTASNSLGATRSSFGYDVSPGTTTSDAMVVANKGTEAVNLKVYTADGYTTDAGQLDLLTGDKKSKAIGAWVRPTSTAVTVAPGRTVEVPFTITVPADATPGDHVGGIVTSLTAPDKTANVNVERRLGIKIKLRVAGDLAPALAIENLDADYHDGSATVSYTIHNTGNAVQTASQAVTVSGPFGWFRADATGIVTPPELLPGESWQVKVPISNVTPALLLTATATVTPLLTDASGSTTALNPVTATATTWAFPWMITLLVAVLIALVILVVVLNRKRRARRKEREDERVREAVEQALREKDTAH